MIDIKSEIDKIDVLETPSGYGISMAELGLRYERMKDLIVDKV